MTSDLKTLKDICKGPWADTNIHELRQEAIRWVKAIKASNEVVFKLPDGKSLAEADWEASDRRQRYGPSPASSISPRPI